MLTFYFSSREMRICKTFELRGRTVTLNMFKCSASNLNNSMSLFISYFY